MLYLATFLFLRPSDDTSLLFLALSISPFFIWVTVRDLASFEIPDLATLGIALLAAVSLTCSYVYAIPSHLISGCLASAAFWLIGEIYFRRTGVEGLGIDCGQRTRHQSNAMLRNEKPLGFFWTYRCDVDFMSESGGTSEF